MKTNNESEKQLREALAKIAEVAGSVAEEVDSTTNGNGSTKTKKGGEATPAVAGVGCTIKSVPARLVQRAAEVAVKVNPVNAPVLGRLAEASASASDLLSPQFLTLLVSKYWGPVARRLTVSFLEPTPADLRTRILSHMNAWSKSGCISFVETAGVGQVRISRGAGGYWSYLGTDITLIPANRQTMNLQGFTMSTPDSEFYRVVRHETGHTLGFPHEHMRQELIARIDPQKAYAYFLQTQGWNKATVDAQVLTPLDTKTIMGTAADQTSIMCYQLPGSITKDGKPIPGGVDINATDYAYNATIYPKIGFGTLAAPTHTHTHDDEWEESEDVQDKELTDTLQSTILPTSNDHGSTDRDSEYVGLAFADHA